MNSLRSASWVFTGLMLAISGAYAEEQEAYQSKRQRKAKASVKKSKSATNKSTTKKIVQPVAQASQMPRAAQANKITEPEARQPAESEAHKQAGLKRARNCCAMPTN